MLSLVQQWSFGTGDGGLFDGLRRVKRAAVRLHASHALRNLIREWHSMRGTAPATMRGGRVRRLLIVPVDPVSLNGSKGDEAMMMACIDELRRTEPGLSATVLVSSGPAQSIAHRLGLESLPLWDRTLSEIVDGIEEHSPDLLMQVGADIMDGSYSPFDAARMLMIADLASRRGIRSHVLGFSWSRQPSPALFPVLDALGPDVRLHVRDARSLARFRSCSRATVHSVADVAFLLQPDLGSSQASAVQTWADQQRSAGRVVLGINLHPMLFGYPVRKARMPQLIDSVSRVLTSLLEEEPVSLVFISHDYRGVHADDECLRPIFAALRQRHGEHLLYPIGPMSAREIKAIAGAFDGVLTGRMHLAIATLGMGVPVLGIAYQDKFEGMFDHFGLSDDLLLTAQDLMQPGPLHRGLRTLLAQRLALTSQIRGKLESVHGAARRNFANLSP